MREKEETAEEIRESFLERLSALFSRLRDCRSGNLEMETRGEKSEAAAEMRMLLKVGCRLFFVLFCWGGGGAGTAGFAFEFCRRMKKLQV